MWEDSDIFIHGVEYRVSPNIDELFVGPNAVTGLQATISPDENTYTQLASVYVVMAVVIGGCAVFYGTLSLVYLIRNIRYARKIEVTPQQICLFLNVIGAFVRIGFVIDPFFGFGVFPFIIENILNTGSYQFPLFGVLIVIFYWDAAMRTYNSDGIPALKKMKIPLLVLIIVIFIMELVSSVLRGLYLDTFNVRIFLFFNSLGIHHNYYYNLYCDCIVCFCFLFLQRSSYIVSNAPSEKAQNYKRKRHKAC